MLISNKLDFRSKKKKKRQKHMYGIMVNPKWRYSNPKWLCTKYRPAKHVKHKKHITERKNRQIYTLNVVIPTERLGQGIADFCRSWKMDFQTCLWIIPQSGHSPHSIPIRTNTGVEHSVVFPQWSDSQFLHFPFLLFFSVPPKLLGLGE